MKPTGESVAVDRVELQRQLLQAGRFFKLICGAGNEDAEEVYKLSLVYTLAGTASIDLSAKPDVVAAAKRAVEDAVHLGGTFGITEVLRPYLTVSVGMAGDPHVRKARILEEACTECNACIPVCPTEAIPSSLVIIESRCIGCGACAVACQDDAVAYAHKEIEMEGVLLDCLAAGAENIELHAAVRDHEPVLKEWELITRLLPKNFVSVCLDRRYLSNHELQVRIERMLERAPGRLIVQADGIPMSGGRDDYNTTLQAIATADIVAKTKLPVFILLSGGTNAKTGELAQACGVPFAGLSIGTFARHLVYEFINDPAFPRNGRLEAAVERARALVATCQP
ncbi:MAG: 4Fe-4S ferredoxin [Candidatus Omnitrophica bacterium CG11_big_fil_rev_8_21_14_0_20_63_9]|nr:MAG: 4Fe-4S ferredoxin [Candidatus Omnitrophica bacterium CG11_big_fil_rev_8_21_14_0_20_63_9]